MLNLEIENKIFSQGYSSIAAFDEAGRGPLAGPVVAACIFIKNDFNFEIISNTRLKEIKDSKKLTEKKRKELYEEIKKYFNVGIGLCDHDTIDKINILQATFLAMKKALSGLKEKPQFIIVDGKFIIPNLSINQKAIVNGDDLVFSIAAASIIAKVTRDNIMYEMHNKYSNYGFDKHKGYGTKLHINNLKAYGVSPIHRKSFDPVKKLLKK